MIIFALPGNETMAHELANKLAQNGSWQFGHLQYHRFPDGESNLRYMDDIEGQDVVLVASLDQPDDKIMPLYFAASIARELGARSVGLVLPYLAHRRTNRKRARSTRPIRTCRPSSIRWAQ